VSALGQPPSPSVSLGPENDAEEGPRAEHGIGITPPTSVRRSRFLPDILVDLGFLPRERVEAAVQEAKASGRTPEQMLVESGALTSDQLARATAERLGVDLVDLSLYKPDPAAINLITAQAARRYGAMPIGFDAQGVLLIAMVDPSNVLALDDLKLMTGHEIRAVVASSDDVRSLIAKMNRLEDALAEATEDEEGEAEKDQASVTDIQESGDNAPVAKLINSIILQAVEERASDIHFEPGERDMRVRFRVDGMLSEATTIPQRMVAGVISRVKVTADLDIAERRLPQDGRISIAVGGRSADIRLTTVPSVQGEGAVMRLIDKDQEVRTLQSLGMNEGSLERVRHGIDRVHGAVLATGPTGSGKSTTLYAALSAINSPEKNIMTVEDPVEYRLAGLSQIQVSLKYGLTFPRGLRSILRADPDVIMVGEIRDSETARIACQAALTGHLVLSTLHTNDAASSITRLTEMGIEPFMTASAVDCVVAQRLARTLCTHCKRTTVLPADALKAAGVDHASKVEVYEATGCPRCGNTGYKGRVGLYEVMRVSDEIRELTVSLAPAEAIKAKAVEQGMQTLRKDGLEKVWQGLTSMAEVARVT
jgi:type IV pilus assembly protein PilB